MARINDLIRGVRALNSQLADDIAREYEAISSRRAFGLNFERHTPEAVELPGRPVRVGDKVHVLPARGETGNAENRVIWAVEAIDKSNDTKIAHLIREGEGGEIVESDIPVADVVVVAEFRDPIYPGLVSTGTVERGGDKPFHSVINAENFHALEALMFTHRGKVDAIYIDPPYNTGAKDWKYNNDYVETEDLYRHSKWLAFMERRLLLAKELLNPDDSVLIVTIDEKEYLRLGLLLEQTFPGFRIQRITSVINQSGVARANDFARVDESIFVVFVGKASPSRWHHNMLFEDRMEKPTGTIWRSLQRAGTNARRVDGANQFYPIWVNSSDSKIHSVGEPLELTESRTNVSPPETGLAAIWPIRADGTEGCWQLGNSTLRDRLSAGTAKLGAFNAVGQTWAMNYLRKAEIQRIESGEIRVLGRDSEGVLLLEWAEASGSANFAPASVWNLASHNAGTYGSSLLRAFVPGRKFPFPKSLYAVEDALRFFVKSKPEATVVDFFSGSGTTAHAVMRLNNQDGGRRVTISVTNNEVSADEHRQLRENRFRPGDPEWEQWGICDYITKPRIAAAITGRTPEGEPIAGNYKFTDEFPMADGLEENVEFFTLTYEDPFRVTANLAFGRVAPLLWLRAGSRGRRIDTVDPRGWDVADAYGVLFDLDRTEEFASAVPGQSGLTHAFVVTDEDRLFEAVVRELPDDVEVVRLYDGYVRNFELEAMRVTR
jgi:adenine-specific DNA-methyltransferase